MSRRSNYIVVFALTLVLISVGVLSYSAISSKKKQVVQSNKKMVYAIPTDTQICFNSAIGLGNNHPLFQSLRLKVPYLNDVSQLKNNLGDSIFSICALQIENSALSPLYIMRGKWASSLNLLFPPHIPSVSINDEDFDLELVTTYRGDVFTLYKSDDIIVFSPSLSLVKESVRAYEFKDSDSRFNLLPDIDTTSNNVVYYKTNFIPLGGTGESSLEEWTDLEWAAFTLSMDSTSIELSTSLVLTDLRSVEANRQLMEGLTYSDKACAYSYLSPEKMQSTLESEVYEGKNRYELYWNQQVCRLLIDYVDQGALIEVFPDSITVAEKILTFNISNITPFRDDFYALLAENSSENKELLKEETIEGYWNAETIPTPMCIQRLLTASRDNRVLYYKIIDNRFICSFNYFILQQYIQNLEQAKSPSLFFFEKNSLLYASIYSPLLGINEYIGVNKNLLPSFIINNEKELAPFGCKLLANIVLSSKEISFNYKLNQ